MKTNIEQAKAQMAQFLGGQVLTFSITPYPNGEWIARCNEVPAIMTGGTGEDLANKDTMMRDAILTAAGIDPEHSDVLRLVGYKPPTWYETLLTDNGAPLRARYVIPA